MIHLEQKLNDCLSKRLNKRFPFPISENNLLSIKHKLLFSGTDAVQPVARKGYLRAEKMGKCRRTWQHSQDASVTYTPKTQSEGSQLLRKQLKEPLRQEAAAAASLTEKNKTTKNRKTPK